MGRLIRLSLAVAAVLSLAAGAAGSASANADAYRSQVNALCRSYTPKLRRVAADMRLQQQLGNPSGVAFDLGLAIGMALREDVAIERTPVPADAVLQMKRPLELLRSADQLLHNALAAVAAKDAKTFATLMGKLDADAKPVNAALDRAGLRDCGSNQT